MLADENISWQASKLPSFAWGKSEAFADQLVFDSLGLHGASSQAFADQLDELASNVS